MDHMSFPQYLLSIGYKAFRKILTGKEWVLTECEFRDTYSSVQTGMLVYFFIKDDIEICCGLSERGKPPTLAHLIFETDDETNRFIKDHSNEEIHTLTLRHINKLKWKP